MSDKFSYEDYEQMDKDDKNEIKKGEKSKNILKSIILIFIILALVITFVVIKIIKNNETTDKIDNNKPNDTDEIKEVEQEIKIIDINSKTRPYAIMINCHNGALPQAGLQDAYIVYELMVEGEITRMMALFKDKTVNKIGSVRSARTQYLDYVYENDAIYVHAGGAKDALNRIASENISDIDVDGVYGVRDTSLNRAWEHKLFTTTDLLNKGMIDKGFRKDTETTSLLKYTSDEIDPTTYNGNILANNISIKYSNYRTSIYTYDSSTKTYLRTMNNTKNIDLVTGEQYQVKNIIVYSVLYSNYTYNNYSGYQKIDNVGTGEGFYITNGYAIPIIWEKSSKNAKTIYKIKDTNEELVVNDGNTYIQIYPTSGNLVIS